MEPSQYSPIDTHQHCFAHSRFSYPWIRPNSPLNRDFLPDEGWQQMQASGVGACVLVEAGADSFNELSWLLELASENPQIAGVVGRIDINQPDLIPSLAANRGFKGIRLTWFEPEQDLEQVSTILKMLAKHNQSCDIMLNSQLLPEIYRVIAAHPDVNFVLNHFAGVRLVADQERAWTEIVREVASLPNTVLKLSGYASSYPSEITLRHYIDAALHLFGAERLLFGSDWPVCTEFGQTYASLVHTLQSVLNGLSSAEQSAIWAGTARRVYRL